jgi:hypothetical protein
MPPSRGHVRSPFLAPLLQRRLNDLASDQQAREALVTAVLTMVHVCREEASAEAANAIAYATRDHSEWFSPGAAHARTWAPRMQSNAANGRGADPLVPPTGRFMPTDGVDLSTACPAGHNAAPRKRS